MAFVGSSSMVLLKLTRLMLNPPVNSDMNPGDSAESRHRVGETAEPLDVKGSRRWGDVDLEMRWK